MLLNEVINEDSSQSDLLCNILLCVFRTIVSERLPYANKQKSIAFMVDDVVIP